MVFTRAAAVLSSAFCAVPLSLAAQDFEIVEAIDRPLVRQNPDSLAIVVEEDAECQIGSDLLADMVVDVLRRGGLSRSEPARSSRDFFALRVAVDCVRGAFLVEVDFVDRVPATSPGGPVGPAVRYMPGYRTVGPLDTPQRTLAAAKRSVEAAINEYLRVNFTTR
jgi:hypothetical protein